MKKLLASIIITLIGLSAKSQNLDTVIVRNLSMQAQDWAWCIGSTGYPSDSAMQVSYRRVRAKIQSNIPGSWTTTVVIDSLSGPYVMRLYRAAVSADAGVIENRYTAIKNAISGKANLAAWIAEISAIHTADFNIKRTAGKNQLIDQ